jgi:hypothetical protein
MTSERERDGRENERERETYRDISKTGQIHTIISLTPASSFNQNNNTSISYTLGPEERENIHF